MRSIAVGLALCSALLVSGCAHDSRVKYPTTDESLGLERVVLYRNGIGYFERQGEVEGSMLTIKVRKDQVNDLLKSLTIVERKTGRAVSVSMPLDPQTWANAALATLAPGQGSLADVLDALRGVSVVLSTTSGRVEGRITMVEMIEDEPDPDSRGGKQALLADSLGRDHRVTLIEENEMHVVRLSKVKGVTLLDGDLAMQFHRSLDATAGEGMFQQVDVSIRLAGQSDHDLLVSYVVQAPMWKPTYRVVLPEGGKGEALLQGWAVVDNTSGEDWRDVRMQLTSGEPIAFRYDLHTPRDVHRSDLTESGVRKRARVAVGETSYDGEEAEREPAPDSTATGEYDLDDDGRWAGKARAKAAEAPPPPPAPPRTSRTRGLKGSGGIAAADKKAADYFARSELSKQETPSIDLESLRRSTQAKARATMISGLTRFDLDERVTVPDGTSTMVAIVNASVQAEETFLYKPGGAGSGYEANPYRVVRFKNSTPFVLEPGPIAIYSGGSFVGEGLSETVGAGVSATVPFAVEPGIMVSSTSKQAGDEMRLIRIVHKILEVESFKRKTTTWTAKAQTMKDGYTVLVRHPKAGWNYKLQTKPPGVEELVDAYLVPLQVSAGRSSGSVEVVEQTPSTISLSIWDSRAISLLENLLVATNIGPAEREKLRPIVEARAEIGRIDTKIQAMEDQRNTLDQRASETRRNLLAIKKDPAAAGLRARLSQRLEQFTSEADRLGREIVELQSQRLEKKIALEDMLENLEYNAPRAPKTKPAPGGPYAPPPAPPAPAGR
ncbi:MAG: DUF4139 domain-containing protein [Deltaproteobacteria bacterium]|jgi:hypothetical protein|nr:DUF4139 domain-containing protein [Deltaproteobacteria bacterium]MBW2532551.1 DUF4139 domain-containing protein [Deltaproteobacteria bacterium]